MLIWETVSTVDWSKFLIQEKNMYHVRMVCLKSKVSFLAYQNEACFSCHLLQFQHQSKMFLFIKRTIILQICFSAWSSDGCRYVGDTSGFRICRCNHLTNFAVLMNVGGGKVTPKEKLALNIITYIGCGISLLAITIMLVTFAVFRSVFLSTI